jgi:hypothetical protein
MRLAQLAAWAWAARRRPQPLRPCPCPVCQRHAAAGLSSRVALVCGTLALAVAAWLLLIALVTP